MVLANWVALSSPNAYGKPVQPESHLSETPDKKIFVSYIALQYYNSGLEAALSCAE